jgi:hypothetical protein
MVLSSEHSLVLWLEHTGGKVWLGWYSSHVDHVFIVVFIDSLKLLTVDFSEFLRFILQVAAWQLFEKFEFAVAEPSRFRLSSNTFFNGLQNNFLPDVLDQIVDSLVNLRLFLLLDVGILCLDAFYELPLLLLQVVVYIIRKMIMVFTPKSRQRI